MNIVVKPSYESLSKAVADEVVRHMQSSPRPLFCPASGDTPSGVFNEIVQRQQSGLIDTSRWHFVGLDEWVGMNGEDEGSCRNYLDRQLFGPLQIGEDRVCFFDGKAKDKKNECTLTEHFISQHDGIDVVLLGIGLNGHIGMNEPGSDPTLFSRVSELHDITKEVGQKYFSSETELSEGLTLGIASIMNARHVILMASGEKKSSIIKEVVEGEITTDVPASLLRNHLNFSIFMDETAAKELNGF
ncbi:glucosamine-6-phosphate deaminase [Chitinophagaceae bacterium 26-R-25]|nr:glucosamine-6-phosphate deaminase [Chitinophagaceae bacterium 26-R-25]